MPTKTAIRRQRDKERKHRVNVVLVVISILVALAVGASQIWYAHQSKLGNRPSISAQASIPRPFAPGERMVLISVLKNFGNAEAHDVSARSSLVPGIFKTDQDAFDALPLLDNGKPNNYLIVSPGEALQQTLATPYVLRPQDYPLLMNGTLKIYFISEISYGDSFGERHGRQVCQFFVPATSLMTFCQTHNSSF